ncbi:predicted protein [Histoplasma capsulatum G186AR]|uniref:Uncharacterized protein n=1 Tax=Ajellomyces capsulatus (strain G186AR / H82 / ATCC MYA-2454 / RMSCC 2432) TaxID=447093 RepID=C0NX52_AJECG|nr:uncharacterized protein HCBG_08044 [Histoplasma capsulatum G186AR]EEH03918.1 predicted protein [Histoplasma capsulatum G186AR]
MSVLKLSTRDLDKLSPSDLVGITELVKLRGKSHPLDVAAVDVKLKNILAKPDNQRARSSCSSGTSTRTRSSPGSPDPEWEALQLKHTRENEEDYHDLIRLGGRPAFPVEMWRTPKDVHGKYGPIVDYWNTGYWGQRLEWISFLKFQQRRRRSVEIFKQYQQEVHRHRQQEGIDGDIQLLFDAKQQSKMDVWKEYHYFQHRNVPKMRIMAEEGRQKREHMRLEWEAEHGKGATLDPNEPFNPALAWLLRSASERNLDKFMILLNWIEQELPKIAQEMVMSNSDLSPIQILENESEQEAVSTNLNIHKNLNSNCRSTNVGGKAATNTVLKADRSSKITKTRKSSRASIHDRTGRYDTTHLAKPHGKGATAPTNLPISPVATLRRSQRITDLTAKKNQQAEPMQQMPPQRISKRVSQNGHIDSKSKRRTQSLQTKPQGNYKISSNEEEAPLEQLWC